MLPLQEAQVQSLVGELRSRMAKGKKKRKQPQRPHLLSRHNLCREKHYRLDDVKRTGSFKIHFVKNSGLDALYPFFWTIQQPKRLKWSEVKVTQSCLTLRDHMGFRLSGSSVHRILQARILEWAGIPFSRGSSWLRDWIWVSCIAGRFFSLCHQGSKKKKKLL